MYSCCITNHEKEFSISFKFFLNSLKRFQEFCLLGVGCVHFDLHKLFSLMV